MNKFVLNETVYFGAGSVEELKNIINSKNYKKIFLVTDKTLIDCKVVSIVENALKNVNYKIFCDIKPNPTVENVLSGIIEFDNYQPDVILAVGGGSVIDTAKAISIIATNREFADVVSLDGATNSKNRGFSLIACPTTAGTAAEVTINYVITDTKTQKKMVCVDANDIPIISIIDANLMASMPAKITAYTGMDALTHALECLITKGANDLSDMFACESAKNIYKYLPLAVEDGKNIIAREKMAYAQYVAGMGFSNVGLGIVHSMAHPLGGRFDIGHGLANAMILPTVLKYNMQSESLPKYRKMAQLFDIDTTNLSDVECAEKAIEAVEVLKEKVGIPKRLSDIGIKKEDIDILSVDAFNDICTGGNPRTTSVEDIKEMYLSIL